MDLFHQLPLAPDAIQHLQQHRFEQLLRGNAGTVSLDVGFVHGVEPLIHRCQNLFDPLPDGAQRMRGQYELLQPDLCEQLLAVPV